ncbi:MAG: cobyric acid synthase [Lachnospiraceae bacterium]
MAKVIMIQGTMSNVGKSLITAGLCRVLRQDGLSVCPFKSQNMALNSYITKDGLEIGRAQAMQAEACGIEPSVFMNPILLKPTSDMGSQVIVNGRPIGNMPAKEYFAYKKRLIPDIMSAYNRLLEQFDFIIVEGAGSPAEINLKADDIVNMGLAKMLDAPVLLVGDIDRGGVFAQLYGTLELLEKEERDRVKGLIINKFRGDIDILKPGIDMLEDKCHIPVFGVIPYTNADIEEEDSQSTRLLKHNGKGRIVIDVILLPKTSNYTDFGPLEARDGVQVNYVRDVSSIGNPDMVIIPGTKNTIEDMKWLRSSGMLGAVMKLHNKGILIMGICGGFQILGNNIIDEQNVEGCGSVEGFGLLPVTTIFGSEKTTKQTAGNVVTAILDNKLKDNMVSGYEIHMGETVYEDGAEPFIIKEDGSWDGCTIENVIGTYFHGIFESDSFTDSVLEYISNKKGVNFDTEYVNYNEYKQRQYDMLADMVRSGLDMSKIYELLR